MVVMAFLRGIVRKCDRCNTAEARYELLTFRNEVYGRYCGRCSKVALRMVQADEAALFERQAADAAHKAGSPK